MTSLTGTRNTWENDFKLCSRVALAYNNRLLSVYTRYRSLEEVDVSGKWNAALLIPNSTLHRFDQSSSEFDNRDTRTVTREKRRKALGCRNPSTRESGSSLQNKRFSILLSIRVMCWWCRIQRTPNLVVPGGDEEKRCSTDPSGGCCSWMTAIARWCKTKVIFRYESI